MVVSVALVGADLGQGLDVVADPGRQGVRQSRAGCWHASLGRLPRCPAQVISAARLVGFGDLGRFLAYTIDSTKGTGGESLVELWAVGTGTDVVNQYVAKYGSRGAAQVIGRGTVVASAVGTYADAYCTVVSAYD